MELKNEVTQFVREIPKKDQQLVAQTGYLDTWSLKKTTGELSLAQRLELAYKTTTKTLFSGLDGKTLALMVDISHWQADVDVALMVRDGKLAMLACKASDGAQMQAGDPTNVRNYFDDWMRRNVQKAFDAGIPCMPYHFVQPVIEGYTVHGIAAWNFQVFKAALEGLVPGVSYHALCLDFEVKKGTDYNGSDVLLEMIEMIAADPEMSQVPLVIYSSMSVYNYFTKARDQLSFAGRNAYLWMAQWSWNVTTTCSWDYFWNTAVPQVEMRVLLPGYANCWGVQWSASFILPGNGGRSDVSLIYRTPAQLYTWLKFKVTPPPPPTPDPQPEPQPAPTDKEAVRQAGYAGVDTFVDTLYGKE